MIDISDLQQRDLLASDAVGIVGGLELQFASATHRFCTFNGDLEAGGHTWLGLGELLNVGELRESAETSTQTSSVSLSVASESTLALALGNVEAYRGRPARIYLILLDTSYRVIGQPRLRQTRYMEPVKVERESPGAQGGIVAGRIEMPLSASGMARARSADGLRLTYEQHWFENPGDRFLEFMAGLIRTPIPWLSKRFQEQ